MSHEVNDERLRSLKSDVHSAIISAIIQESSLDKSDVLVYPRQQQRIYLKYTDEIMRLIKSYSEAYADEARLDELGSVIPNFDGSGTVGFQYDDGARVSIHVRINQLDEQLTNNTSNENLIP